MISKMDEQGKWKKVKNEEGRKEEMQITEERIGKRHREGQEGGRKKCRLLRSELERDTEKAKKEYIDNISDKIM